MRRAPRRAAALIGALIGAATMLAAAPAVPDANPSVTTPDPAREHAAAILADEELQTELPNLPAVDPQKQKAPRRGSPDPSDSVPSPLGALARALLYALAAGALIVVVFWALRQRHDAALDETAKGGESPEAKGAFRHPALASLEKAQALAAEGRFAEAIHVLLLSALGWLARQRDAPLDPAMTSREILRDQELAEPVRAALRDLVLAVEISRFGGEDAGAADFERSKASYERLIAALSA